MLAALFSPVRYDGRVSQPGWPVPVTDYSSDLAQASMSRALDEIVLAEDVGFDWVSLAEHHYAPLSLSPNPMVMAAAVAQRVKRVRIALLGSSLPIQNPVRVAEELAMLDTLTGGRVVAGMLRGTSNEYVTYGVNPAESRERFAEALDLVLRAWTEPEPFGWLGRYYEYRTVSIWPRPVQAPHPPVLTSISSPEMAELAAANRLGAGLAVTSGPLARDAVARYREAASRHGWQPDPEQVLYRVPIHLAPTDGEAADDLAPLAAPRRPAGALSASNAAIDEAAARAGYYGADAAHQRARVHAGGDLGERIATGRLLLGSPASVLDQIRSIHRELGAGVLEVVLASPTPDKARRTLELFGEAVLPGMRSL